MFEIKKYKGGWCIKSNRLNRYVYGVGMKIKKIIEYKGFFIIYNDDYTYQLLNTFLEPVYGDTKFNYFKIERDNLMIISDEYGHFLLSLTTLKEVLGEGKRFFRIKHQKDNLYLVHDDVGNFLIDINNLQEVLGKDLRFSFIEVSKNHIIVNEMNDEANDKTNEKKYDYEKIKTYKLIDKNTYETIEKTIKSSNFVVTQHDHYLCQDDDGYFLINPETLEEFMQGERYVNILYTSSYRDAYYLKEELEYNFIYYFKTNKYEQKL